MPRGPVATVVCTSARHALEHLIGEAPKLRITDSHRSNIMCLLDAHALHVSVNAQAVPQAWTQFDTTVSHQAQTYGPTPLHNPAELPHDMVIAGANAAWIPAERRMIATNASQSHGGNYMIVKVSGSAARGALGLAAARAVTRAALPLAPRGTDPGPPPS